MSAARNIAIDGPAGSGKSTAAVRVAAALGMTYLDTGQMYRAVAYRLLSAGGDPAVVADALQLQLDGDRVLADGEDLTGLLATPEVSQEASRVAALPEVRRALVAQQRRLVAAGGYVAAGRDIGTVVLPHAGLKIFLTADVAERARRRAQETGEAVAEVQAALQERDARDAGREVDPLRAAEDALHLDSTRLSLDQVVEIIVAVARARGVA